MENFSSDQRRRSFQEKILTLLRKVTLFRIMLGTLGLKLLAGGLGFINNILLARLISPEEFGLYSIAISIINLCATIALMGLPAYVTREVAVLAETEKWSQLKSLLRFAHLLVFLASALLISVLLLILSFNLIDIFFPWEVVFFGLVIYPIFAFNQLRAAILRGLHRVVLADIPELLLRPFLFFLILSLAWYVNIAIDVVNILSTQLLLVVIGLILGSFWLMKYQPLNLKSANSEPIKLKLIVITMPFFAITLINTLEGQISLYLLGYLSGVKQAGLFQAANQVATLVSIGLVAVNLPLQSKLAVAWAKNQKNECQRLITETARAGVFISLIGVIAMLFFAKPILGLYGSEYVEASNALRILALGQIINAVAGSCATLLLMAGYQKIVIFSVAVAFLLNLSFSYLAIPQYGLIGGAFAATLAMLTWNLLCAGFAWRKLNLNTTIFVKQW